jgi:hypothetical protein
VDEVIAATQPPLTVAPDLLTTGGIR